jgi:hypothetical protein
MAGRYEALLLNARNNKLSETVTENDKRNTIELCVYMNFRNSSCLPG